MVYLHCPRDLNNSLVEKTVQVGMCARKPPNVDQNADMTAQLVQHFVRLPDSKVRPLASNVEPAGWCQHAAIGSRSSSGRSANVFNFALFVGMRTDEKGTTVLRRARQAETASHINKRVSSHDYGRPCH
jgi:hypothetical protein